MSRILEGLAVYLFSLTTAIVLQTGVILGVDKFRSDVTTTLPASVTSQLNVDGIIINCSMLAHFLPLLIAAIGIVYLFFVIISEERAEYEVI